VAELAAKLWRRSHKTQAPKTAVSTPQSVQAMVAAARANRTDARAVGCRTTASSGAGRAARTAPRACAARTSRSRARCRARGTLGARRLQPQAPRCPAPRRARRSTPSTCSPTGEGLWLQTPAPRTPWTIYTFTYETGMRPCSTTCSCYDAALCVHTGLAGVTQGTGQTSRPSPYVSIPKLLTEPVTRSKR